MKINKIQRKKRKLDQTPSVRKICYKEADGKQTNLRACEGMEDEEA